MKAQILKFLRSRKVSVCEEDLSAALGISGVSIRQHIHELQECGYQILSTSGGFRLAGEPDILFPWEYQGDAAHILYYPEVTSTMDIARDMAKKDCPDLTVVIAGRQTKGRGRLKRRWLSDDGGLYFTMVLRPVLPVQMIFKVNFLASLTLAQVMREMFQIDAKVKWPNDILVDERKVSGMLSELEAEADRVFFICIGMGINVNNDPSGAETAATSLKKIMGRKVARKVLLSRFLTAFSEGLKTIEVNDVISQWKKYTLTLGRHVKIATHRDTAQGLAVDVDNNGALILELADGGRKKIVYGDCFLI